MNLKCFKFISVTVDITLLSWNNVASQRRRCTDKNCPWSDGRVCLFEQRGQLSTKANAFNIPNIVIIYIFVDQLQARNTILLNILTICIHHTKRQPLTLAVSVMYSAWRCCYCFQKATLSDTALNYIHMHILNIKNRNHC